MTTEAPGSSISYQEEYLGGGDGILSLSRAEYRGNGVEMRGEVDIRCGTGYTRSGLPYMFPSEERRRTKIRSC